MKKKNTGARTPNNVVVTVGEYSTKPAPGIKTSGIKVRGVGAATKGTMARGPMG